MLVPSKQTYYHTKPPQYAVSVEVLERLVPKSASLGSFETFPQEMLVNIVGYDPRYDEWHQFLFKPTAIGAYAWLPSPHIFGRQ